MVAAVRMPILELPSPGGMQFRLRCVRRDAKHKVVVGQGTAVVRRGRTSFVSRRTELWKRSLARCTFAHSDSFPSWPGKCRVGTEVAVGNQPNVGSTAAEGV